jgi:hypothetical protein
MLNVGENSFEDVYSLTNRLAAPQPAMLLSRMSLNGNTIFERKLRFHEISVFGSAIQRVNKSFTSHAFARTCKINFSG